jgi:hypothetical protein
MPELSDEEFKALLAGYVRAHRTPGVSVEEGHRLRIELLARLNDIYSAAPLTISVYLRGFSPNRDR